MPLLGSEARHPNGIQRALLQQGQDVHLPLKPGTAISTAVCTAARTGIRTAARTGIRTMASTVLHTVTATQLPTRIRTGIRTVTGALICAVIGMVGCLGQGAEACDEGAGALGHVGEEVGDLGVVVKGRGERCPEPCPVVAPALRKKGRRKKREKGKESHAQFKEDERMG